MTLAADTPSAFQAAAAEAARSAAGLDWLATVRAGALQRFAERGFPTTAEEDWRYTDLRETARRIVAHAARGPLPAAPAAQRAIAERLMTGALGEPLLFIDGLLARRPSAKPHLHGLMVSLLSEIDPARQDELARRITGPGGDDGNLAALNAALLRQGAVVDVAPGTDISAPIYIACANATDSTAQNRILLHLGAGSRATLVEHHLGIAEGISNSATDVICEADSVLDYVKLQDDSPSATHLASQRLRLARGAHARLVHLDIGAQLARNDLQVDLAGAGAEVSAHGLFFADGERHLDHHTRIEHRAPQTVSRELYRGVVDDHGRGVFNGKVIVHAGAAGTDARLTNQNLLLSPHAEVDTKPELEIYADDVRCSHGATTGQLDENAIFYLRSRGIDTAQARRMLIASFIREIIGRLPGAALAAHVAALLSERLPELREVAEGP